MNLKTNSQGLPDIDRVGHFDLINPVFDFVYRNPTDVIHLFEYYGRIRIGTKEFDLRPGDMTCIPNGTTYGMESASPGKHWCVHYNEVLEEETGLLELPCHLQLGVNSIFYREQMQLISHLFNHQDQGKSPSRQAEARFRLKALLLSLHRLHQNPRGNRRSQSNFSWQHLLQCIDRNINRPLSVSDIAEHVNLAPGTIARKFKKEHQLSLSQYILHRRIDKAKLLLATTTKTIYEVGMQVGIPDPQYFNKQFRKVSGMSPSHYRDQNIEFLSNIPPELSTHEGDWVKD